MSLEHPDWSNSSDRALYFELFYTKTPRPLTEQEQSFVNWMYHAEEYASGLDGDRDD